LAQHTRCWDSASSSGIVPSQRYSEIGFHQSTSGLGGPMTVAISPSGPRFGLMGPTGSPWLTSKVGAEPSFSWWGHWLWYRVGLSSSGEAPSMGTGISSSSLMEGLNKSCVNTLRGGGSRLDLSWVRASAVPLSRRRMW
jgi:hypothetical protein